jgi:hypothetical protein
MKTTTKQFTAYGNLAIIQFFVEPGSTFPFKPAGPEMQSGRLVISEATGEGVVGKLIALNNTDEYLLLTDADVLAGAKQNRVLNKSVLLAPMTKTILDVSCVERRRWHYNSSNFSNDGNAAGPDLRREKAASEVRRKTSPGEPAPDTQRTVWSHVSSKMSEMNFMSSTESYNELQKFGMENKGLEFPACEPDPGCNGLAVYMDSKVICADIFGTAEVFGYYFTRLRDSAFRMALTGKNLKSPDMHEAYYKVTEALDNFETAVRHPEGSYPGAGAFKIAESHDLVGFELTYENQVIHDVLFAK